MDIGICTCCLHVVRLQFNARTQDVSQMLEEAVVGDSVEFVLTRKEGDSNDVVISKMDVKVCVHPSKLQDVYLDESCRNWQ